MVKTNLLFEKHRENIENEIKKILSARQFSVKEIEAPFVISDLLSKNIKSILGSLIREYSPSLARRVMVDMAFKDKDGFYYVVDVKTHRLDTVFNMPNLTSVERIARFYEDDSNYFVILKADYEVTKTKVVIKKVHFVPIEFLSWECLTIGALGWGQIQIANSNRMKLIPQNSRKKWMIQLCNNLFEFYPNEISKINERVLYFKKVKAYWRKKTE